MMQTKFNRIRIYLGLVDPAGNTYSASYKQLIHEAMECACIPGYTIINTSGCWEGEEEPSVIIEVLVEESPGSVNSIAHELSQWLKRVFRQDCVIVTTEPVHGAFI